MEHTVEQAIKAAFDVHMGMADQEQLDELLDQVGWNEAISFEDAGLMTNDRGVVLTYETPDGERGELQITIVRSL